MKQIDLPPDPSSLVESMRDIGYSLETAIADLVDNSITAGAKNIDLIYSWNDGEAWLAIIDNGHGMNSDELTTAMRLGSRNPLESREVSDLGRFGLGLKTASFSQCRQLTVVSKTKNDLKIEGREWNLDRLRNDNSGAWNLSVLGDTEIAAVPGVERIQAMGTVVLWRLMDRLDKSASLSVAEIRLNELLSLTREHLQLVFHRFLAAGARHRITLTMNGHQLEPFDPFHPTCPATQHLPSEPVEFADSRIEIQPYILPHHSKVSKTLYEAYAGPGGYRRNQGFYVYRNHRLIIWGTWFRLAAMDELTKLARVRIDIPNTLDHLWNIDVKKSRANPPEVIKSRLRQIIQRIRESGEKVYRQKGARLSSQVHEPIWLRRAAEGHVRYEINRNHAMVARLLSKISGEQRQEFLDLIGAIENRFPIENFYNDMATEPEKVERASINEDTLIRIGKFTVAQLLEAGVPENKLRDRLSQMDPFATEHTIIDKILRIQEEEIDA